MSYPDVKNNPGVKLVLDEKLEEIKKEWDAELKYIEKNGFRADSPWWDTTHNSIYDIRNKILWVTVHEWYDKVKEFSL